MSVTQSTALMVSRRFAGRAVYPEQRGFLCMGVRTVNKRRGTIMRRLHRRKIYSRLNAVCLFWFLSRSVLLRKSLHFLSTYICSSDY
jgi:hypothetical protein